MKRRSLLSNKLYRALFEISSLRGDVKNFGPDAARFLSRLDDLESKANRLADRVETRHSVASH
jgi:hypothetical protein